jgi:hypothetical protein
VAKYLNFDESGVVKIDLHTLFLIQQRGISSIKYATSFSFSEGRGFKVKLNEFTGSLLLPYWLTLKGLQVF